MPADREELLKGLGDYEKLIKMLARKPRRPEPPDERNMVAEIMKLLERGADECRRALRRLPVH